MPSTTLLSESGNAMLNEVSSVKYCGDDDTFESIEIKLNSFLSKECTGSHVESTALKRKLDDENHPLQKRKITASTVTNTILHQFGSSKPNESITTFEVDEQRHDFNLPKFSDSSLHMWTSTHEANAPSEDRHASLVNLLLIPKDHSGHQNQESIPLIRVSMWCVLDGHGGGSVASYASEVLLPHIAASIAKALNCAVLSQGLFHANGKQRKLDAIDLSKLLINSTSAISRLNPFSINYTAPERTQAVYYNREVSSDDDIDNDDSSVSSTNSCSSHSSTESNEEENNQSGRASPLGEISLPIDEEDSATGFLKGHESRHHHSCESPNLTGTHSSAEVSAVSKAITNSFLSVDEGWLNSIDASKVQSSCVAGGSWNSGACALVACIIQRLDCCSSSKSLVDAEAELTSDSSSCNLEEICRKRIQDEDDIAKKTQSSVPNVLFAHDAMLYTAHCGDCRAVLGTSVGTSVMSPDSSSADPEVKCQSDSDYDSKGFESDESDDEEYERFGYSYLDSKPRPSMYSSLMGYESKIVMSGAITTKSLAKQVYSPSPEAIPCLLKSVDLTVDHSAYNPIEVKHVLRRCKNGPRAIATASSGGISRVAGSLAVTRALGDAYLKTPHLSFSPYKQHAPYISGQPEISYRTIAKDKDNGTLLDKYIVLASDGLWERADGEDVLSWIQSYFHLEKPKQYTPSAEHRSLPLRFRWSHNIISPQNVSDYVVNRLLREIRKAKKLSLGALMSIPTGRGRRSKHDDITASVIDVSGFVI